MRHLFLIFSFFFVVQLAYTQSLTPTAIISGGKTTKRQGVALSYAIGQIFPASPTNSKKLTTGIYQPSTPKGRAHSQQNNAYKKIQARIYPNPCTDKLVASFSEELPDFLLIKIVDISGRCVHMQELTGASQLNNIEVETSYLPDGQYIFQLIAKEQNRILTGQKFIKKQQ